MVVEVKLVNEPTEKTYWFQVGKKLVTAIIRKIGMEGEIKDIYLLVDTARGYKIGKMLNYREKSSPDGIYPTKFAVCLLNREQVNDFFNDKMMKEKRLQLENKVNNLFYKLRNNTTMKLPLDIKFGALLWIYEEFKDDEQFNKDFSEIISLYNDVNFNDLNKMVHDLLDKMGVSHD